MRTTQFKASDDRLVEGRVWLRTHRWNTAYLYDVVAGKPLRKVRFLMRVGRSAGWGVQCGDRFLALHLDRKSNELLLRVDERVFPLDGQTIVERSRKFAGLVSRLDVARSGEPGVRLSKFTPWLLLYATSSDPDRDSLDAAGEDIFAVFSDVARDPSNPAVRAALDFEGEPTEWAEQPSP